DLLVADAGIVLLVGAGDGRRKGKSSGRGKQRAAAKSWHGVFLLIFVVTDSPHPEERPQGASRRVGTSTSFVAHASRRPLRGLLSMRSYFSQRIGMGVGQALRLGHRPAHELAGVHVEAGLEVRIVRR